MSAPRLRVYLHGAYGPGNLGDDVLLLASLAALEGLVPRAEVAVGAARPEELVRLAPGVQAVREGTRMRAQVLLYGGGGQFFGFDRPGGARRRLRRLLRGETRLADALRNLYIRSTGRAPGGPVEARLTAGLGLGVGPFTPGSTSEAIARRALAACSFLSVRDPASLALVRSWRIGQARLGADLSLDLASWWSGPPPGAEGPADTVAFIPRHWPWTESGSRAVGLMAEAAARLKARGRKVVLVSLDPAGDRPLVRSLPAAEWLAWDPMADSPAGFLRRLRESAGAVVSARAHGLLLCGAIGIPPVGVRVEPKLEAAHGMLPRGSRLWTAPFDPAALVLEAERALEERAERARLLAADLAVQVERLRQDAAAFRAWLGRALVA